MPRQLSNEISSYKLFEELTLTYETWSNKMNNYETVKSLIKYIASLSHPQTTEFWRISRELIGRCRFWIREYTVIRFFTFLLIHGQPVSSRRSEMENIHKLITKTNYEILEMCYKIYQKIHQRTVISLYETTLSYPSAITDH